MAVNWTRGFRRIAFLLSVAGAILGAILLGPTFYEPLCLEPSTRRLNEAQRRLTRVQEEEYRHSTEGEAIIREWTATRSWKEQQSLWVRWTGHELGWELECKLPLERLEQACKYMLPDLTDAEKARIQDVLADAKANAEKVPIQDVLAETSLTLAEMARRPKATRPGHSMTLEEMEAYSNVRAVVLDTLRERGWKMLNGRAMEYLPEEAWHMRRRRALGDLKGAVMRLAVSRRAAQRRAHRMAQCGGYVIGCATGFGAVWLAYLLLERVVWLLYKLVQWVAYGFRAAVTKQLQPKRKKRPELKLTDVLFILRPFVVAAVLFLLAVLIAFLYYYYE